MRSRSLVGFVGLLAWAALALPTAASAQNVCFGAFDGNLTGPNFGVVGSVYTVTLDVGAGNISGTDPQFLDINRLRYELDCANNAFVNCVDEGEIIVVVPPCR
jgi:hypothetical protein